MSDCPENADQFFLFINGALVFFLQAGFAMLEVGSVRSKNATNILFKNMMDVVIGAFAWFIVGYAFAFGGSDSKFVGTEGFFMTNIDECNYAMWFFQWTFAATACTIISGAVAERAQVQAYVAYSLIVTGFVYPLVVHWTWSDNAWLAEKGFKDFAGSGVVHTTGGIAALMGCYWIGPRVGRYGEGGKPGNDYPGNSLPLAALGTLILVFGFFAFNGGSVLSITNEGDGAAVAKAVVNTVMSAAGAGLTAVLGHHYLSQKISVWSLKKLMNGLIGGMVAICAGAGSVEPWAAMIIGCIAGFVYLGWSSAMTHFHLDDPLDAVAVHLGCGAWGVFAEALFASRDGIFYTWSTTSFDHLGWEVAGLCIILLWSGSISYILFMVLHKMEILRVSKTIELKGLDIHEHGEAAYFMDDMLHELATSV